MCSGDVAERFENYAAFRSDGAKVKLKLMHTLVVQGVILDAKPNIGAPYAIKPRA